MFNKFIPEVRQLRHKGRQLRQLHNIYQSLGLIATTGSAVGLATAAWPVIPLLVGLSMYGGSVLSEKKRIGRLALMPFSNEDLQSQANRALDGGAVRQLPVRDTHYLSLEDKALFYLVNEQGPRLTVMAEAMDPDQLDYVVGVMVDRLCQHEGFLNDPNAIEQARVSNGEISPDYYFQDALGALPADAKKLLPGGILAGAKPEVFEPADSAPTANENQLGAIDVAHSPVAATPAQSALDILVNNAAVSRGIYGGQRTGKSYLCAVASLQRAKAKSAKVFFINLNAFDAEDGYYWKHAHQCLAVNIHTMNESQAKGVITRALAIVGEFQRTPNSLLIVDEWSSCGSKTMANQGLIEQFTAAVANANNAVSPTAIKRKQAIWLLTPSIVATEMIQAAKTIKSLQPMVVAIAPGHDVFYDGARLTFDTILYQQVSQNYSGMLADTPSSFNEPRMVQVDKAWVPVGVTGHELDEAKAAYAGAAPTPSPSASTDSFSASDMTPPKTDVTEREQWEALRGEAVADGNGMAEVIDWLMATKKEIFCPRDARNSRKLRPLGTDKVTALFDRLVEDEWLIRDGDTYQLAHPL